MEGEQPGEIRRLQKHKTFSLVKFSQLPQASFNLPTAYNLLAAYVYVSFRSQQPDDETVNDAMTDLKAHNIDDSQLVAWPAFPCAQAESSTEKDVPHRDVCVGMEGNLLRMQSFWTTEYSPCKQSVVPVLGIVLIYLNTSHLYTFTPLGSNRGYEIYNGLYFEFDEYLYLW